MESGLKSIDWSSPWLTSVRILGVEITAAKNWRIALNAHATKHGIYNHANLPIQFISQQELPEGTAYEAHISATGKVPTRDNLHDCFNALVWLTFPAIKAQLNALQAKQIERCGIGKSRGATRDAATLFDENAALLAVSNTPEGRAIVDALHKHQWHNLFVEHRQQFIRHAEVFLFGHAIMEKLVRPYKAITAHTIICWVDPPFHRMNNNEKCADLDQKIAKQLQKMELLPTAFSPLPVLGVPNWWQGQSPEFYADEFVFRPERQRKIKTT
ncbi:MAG: hypothetical protein K0R08_2187 [Solimicrobium sp.]|jgi:hypothetical protein|nr:hypothetical protein [Solimicrobium sp.]